MSIVREPGHYHEVSLVDLFKVRIFGVDGRKLPPDQKAKLEAMLREQLDYRHFAALDAKENG